MYPEVSVGGRVDGGKVCMEGTPAQVFARASELESVGLDVPAATKLAAALRRRGFCLDSATFTVESLTQQLLGKEVGTC